jgi:hypothetical protein
LPTSTPLVEPASVTRMPRSVSITSQCRRETVSSVSTKSFSGEVPIRADVPAASHVSPVSGPLVTDS